MTPAMPLTANPYTTGATIMTSYAGLLTTIPILLAMPTTGGAMDAKMWPEMSRKERHAITDMVNKKAAAARSRRQDLLSLCLDDIWGALDIRDIGASLNMFAQALCDG